MNKFQLCQAVTVNIYVRFYDSEQHRFFILPKHCMDAIKIKNQIFLRLWELHSFDKIDFAHIGLWYKL